MFHIHILIDGVIYFNNYYLTGIHSGEKMGYVLSNFRTIVWNLRKDQLLAVLMLIIPVNIFFSARFNGFGAQFPLFRTDGDNFVYSIVPITEDLNFVTLWLVLWIFGVGILISGIILSFLEQENIRQSFRRTGILLAVSGIFFILSVMLQYNFKFSRQEIMIIPLGIPVMMLLGWWIYRDANNQSPNGPTR